MDKHPSIPGAWAEQHALPNQYASRLLIIDGGSGVYLSDGAGKRYLDCASGIAVNALGYGRDDLAELMAAQAKKLIHISNLFANRPALELADKLCSASPRPADQPWSAEKPAGYFKAVHFGNSGTEANEAAIKYARAYHYRLGRRRKGILAFTGSFHGRTMGALSVTATEKYRKPFEPLLPGGEFAPFNDVPALQRKIGGRRGRRYAAVIVEAIQGEGGINAMNPDFAAALNRMCRESGILLIADEVQTGLGRTGTLLASEAVGLEPDIVTLSKPLAGGLPLSATLLSPAVADRVAPGDHASTFGGGPVTCAVANRIWDEITAPGFLDGVRERSAYLEQRLEALRDAFPAFFVAGEAVRGLGMLRGLRVTDGERLPEIIETCMDEGLLVLRAGSDVLRLAPPLIIERKHIDEMETIVRTVLGRVL
jgi:acetylornithine/N-succinyldiaminopimelate aminotransferase